MNKSIVKNFANNCNPQKNLPENVDVAMLIRFMQQIKIPELFAALPDSRQQSKVTYSLSSLALWSFATCIFRQGSKNAFHTTLEQLSLEQREGMMHFLGITGKDFPHPSTVDDALAHLHYENLNQMLLEMFNQMNTRKIFYNHAATLLPDSTYYIGTDGYHLHTYTRPHAVDEHGHNNCPHCLPRRHNVGTEKETVSWVHVVITFVFICDDFKIPLYVYPLKAKQVNTEQSDEKLKQECELNAAHAVLPLIRKRFPKLHFTFLGDGLYANRPFMRLCNHLNFGYNIVRKENSLTMVGKKCDELAKLELYQKSYSHQENRITKNGEVKSKAAWFNGVDLGEGLSTNVLRFEEKVIGAENKVCSRYKGEWLCSGRLSKTNCFRKAKSARLRWSQEDFHNSCKKRGFNIEHDMTRTNPDLLFTWKLMTFVAFFVFEIFNLSTAAKSARGSRSLMKFAKDMLQELVNIAWDKIKQSLILKKEKVQFRFCFESSA
jgi:hypothetical protein